MHGKFKLNLKNICSSTIDKHKHKELIVQRFNEILDCC